MATWADIAGSDTYQNASPEFQQVAQQHFFDNYIATQVPKEHLEVAKAQFDKNVNDNNNDQQAQAMGYEPASVRDNPNNQGGAAAALYGAEKAVPVEKIGSSIIEGATGIANAAGIVSDNYAAKMGDALDKLRTKEAGEDKANAPTMTANPVSTMGGEVVGGAAMMGLAGGEGAAADLSGEGAIAASEKAEAASQGVLPGLKDRAAEYTANAVATAPAAAAANAASSPYDHDNTAAQAFTNISKQAGWGAAINLGVGAAAPTLLDTVGTGVAEGAAKGATWFSQEARANNFTAGVVNENAKLGTVPGMATDNAGSAQQMASDIRQGQEMQPEGVNATTTQLSGNNPVIQGAESKLNKTNKANVTDQAQQAVHASTENLQANVNTQGADQPGEFAQSKADQADTTAKVAQDNIDLLNKALSGNPEARTVALKQYGIDVSGRSSGDISTTEDSQMRGILRDLQAKRDAGFTINAQEGSKIDVSHDEIAKPLSDFLSTSPEAESIIAKTPAAAKRLGLSVEDGSVLKDNDGNVLFSKTPSLYDVDQAIKSINGQISSVKAGKPSTISDNLEQEAANNYVNILRDARQKTVEGLDDPELQAKLNPEGFAKNNYYNYVQNKANITPTEATGTAQNFKDTYGDTEAPASNSPDFYTNSVGKFNDARNSGKATAPSKTLESYAVTPGEEGYQNTTDWLNAHPEGVSNVADYIKTNIMEKAAKDGSVDADKLKTLLLRQEGSYGDSIRALPEQYRTDIENQVNALAYAKSNPEAVLKAANESKSAWVDLADTTKDGNKAALNKMLKEPDSVDEYLSKWSDAPQNVQDGVKSLLKDRLFGQEGSAIGSIKVPGEGGSPTLLKNVKSDFLKSITDPNSSQSQVLSKLTNPQEYGIIRENIDWLNRISSDSANVPPPDVSLGSKVATEAASGVAFTAGARLGTWSAFKNSVKDILGSKYNDIAAKFIQDPEYALKLLDSFKAQDLNAVTKLVSDTGVQTALTSAARLPTQKEDVNNEKSSTPISNSGNPEYVPGKQLGQPIPPKSVQKKTEVSQPHNANFSELENQHGLPHGLLNAVMQVESRGNPNAVSPKGAQGAFQFMPATAKAYGIDPKDPQQAAEGGATYLGDLLDQYNGDLRSALAAYNWGPHNLDTKGFSNAPRETKNYVNSVLARL